MDALKVNETTSDAFSAESDAFFDCVIACTEDEQAQAQLIAALQKRCNNPPTQSVNAVLEKQLSDEEGGVMQLSAALLSGLSAWSGRGSCCPEERQLARQLLQDFSPAGPAPSLQPARTLGSSGVVAVEYEPQVDVYVVADRTVVNSDPASEAARLKAAGNDAFKSRDWATAIQMYRSVS
eukprot:gene5391-5625_t